MVYVFPVPVAPYAITLTLTPHSTRSTSALTLSNTSLWLASGPKVRVNLCCIRSESARRRHAVQPRAPAAGASNARESRLAARNARVDEGERRLGLNSNCRLLFLAALQGPRSHKYAHALRRRHQSDHVQRSVRQNSPCIAHIGYR